jgi:hypothetical protein
MPYELFKFIHVAAVIFLVSFTFYAFANPIAQRRKLALSLTGIASLVVFITGLGMAHVWSWPIWLFAKLAIWLAISAFTGIVFRRTHLAGRLGLITAVLVVAATWLVYFKPF